MSNLAFFKKMLEKHSVNPLNLPPIFKPDYQMETLVELAQIRGEDLQTTMKIIKGRQADPTHQFKLHPGGFIDR